MELRHLRYFVAVAEEGSFLAASTRLRVAQPALSKQVRDLENEIGAVLFQRGPRGVHLTAAGRAFLAEARHALEVAARAVASARGAAAARDATLRFAHGELPAYGLVIENLLAAFRTESPDAQVDVSSIHDGEIFHALRDRNLDIGSVFIIEPPAGEFASHRLIPTPLTGVLLPGHHPLATKPAVRLADLRPLIWFHSGPRRWPGFVPALENALRDRGLVPERRLERSKEAPALNVQIAAGDAFSLATEELGEPYIKNPNGIVYRPFREPPIACWLALVWLPPAAPSVDRLVQSARALGLTVPST